MSSTIDRLNEGIAIFSRYWMEVEVEAEAEAEGAEWREAQQSTFGIGRCFTSLESEVMALR